MGNDLKERMRRGGRDIAQRSINRDTARAARAQAGSTDTTQWVDIADIIIDESIQVRIGGTDPETVKQYATIMYEHEGWGPFPDITLHRDGKKLYLSAGFHRLDAAAQASEWLKKDGKGPITQAPCQVRPGGHKAAVEFAEEDNLKNSKALTRQDRHEIFERRWERGHAWQTLGSRQIAAELGVDRRTIDRWRAKLEEKSTGANAPDQPELRVGADGKTRDVSGVQEANRVRVLKARIVDALVDAGGELSPSKLRKATSTDFNLFNAAIADLLEEEGIVRRQDMPGSPTVIRLSKTGDNSEGEAPSGVTNVTPEAAGDEPAGHFEDQPEGMMADRPVQPREVEDLDQPDIMQALVDFTDAGDALRKHIKSTVGAIDAIPPDYRQRVLSLVNEAQDMLKGYQSPNKELITGVFVLLHKLRDGLNNG